MEFRHRCSDLMQRHSARCSYEDDDINEDTLRRKPRVKTN